MRQNSVNLGYCCINTSLQAKGITTNRSMKKATFQKFGLARASKLALANCQDLVEVMCWNAANSIKLFRISSSLFPWMSEYELADLADYQQIVEALKEVGEIAKQNSIRLTMHPGHFCVIASPNQSVVKKSQKELEQHSEIMDMIGLSATPYNAINIHVNGVYGNKTETAQRFCEMFYELSDNCRRRITLENDDKPGQWSTSELYHYFHQTRYLYYPPIVFDYLHHKCHSLLLTEEEALVLAKKTWPEGVTQLCHYSSSIQNEQPKKMFRAHADMIYETIATYGLDLDIELEAKKKELALFNYLRKETA